MSDYNQGTGRTLQGNLPSRVISRDDPERRGRVQVMPINFDISKMNIDDLPWAYINSGPKSHNLGSTPHTDYTPGQYVIVNFGEDGQTGYITDAPTQDAGADAASGSQQAAASQQAQPTYPYYSQTSKA